MTPASPSTRAPSRPRRLLTDRRIRERRRQVVASRVRRRRLQVGAGLLLLCLAVGVVKLARSPLFGLTAVRVEGEAALTRNQVIAASGVRLGESYLPIDLGAIQRRLEALPRVARAIVTREYPSGLRIVIQERQPTAALSAGSGGYWLVAGDGTVLAAVRQRPSGLPYVADVPLPAGSRPGTRLAPNNPLANALRALDQMASTLRQQVVAVTAHSIDSLEFQLRGGARVLYGLADQQAAKDAAVLLIQQQLRAQGKQVVHIDVRNPATPTVQTTTSKQQGSAR